MNYVKLIGQHISIFHFYQKYDKHTYCKYTKLEPLDTILTYPPIGTLCKQCKEKYLKTHTENELILELL